MRLHIVARGRIARTPEAEIVARYVARVGSRGLGPLVVTELPEVGGSVPPALNPSRTVALDERGTAMSSVALATLLEDWRDAGVREARFLIGAADGLSDAECDGADRLLSFGHATWPHLLVRAMLAEQLYRAMTIAAGHPYHREG